MNFGKIKLISIFQTYAIPWGIKLLSALVIAIIGWWLAGVLSRLWGKAMTRFEFDPMLSHFLQSIIKALIEVIVIVIALGQMGVQTTSLIAILGAAGLAIGLALQNSLANFAAGVLLLIFKPFKAGDFVEAGGVTGSVEHLRIFSSVFHTPDNREIIVPNAKIYNDVIVNYSARDTRRIDLVVGIGYESDLRKAKNMIAELIRADQRILEDPLPAFGVMDLGENSVNLFVRLWVKSEHFWDVRCDFLERLKTTFDDQGISIPYPQMDIHLYQTRLSK